MAGAVSAHVFAPETKTATVPTVTQPVSTSGTGAELALENAVQRTAPSVVEVKTDVAGQRRDRGADGPHHHQRPRRRPATARVMIVSATIMSGRRDRHRPAPTSPCCAPRVPGPGVADGADPGGLRQLGDTVFAIGSPFGLQNTVTSGVVSSLGRTGTGQPVIQSDTPVNPGNSGGGLFDLRGRLVGIPTDIRSPVPGNVGIGFAVTTSPSSPLLDRAH